MTAATEASQKQAGESAEGTEPAPVRGKRPKQGEPVVEPGVEAMPEGQLRRTLSDVHRTGVAMIRRSMPSLTVSVASPILDAQGSVVAALSIVVPDGSTPPNVLAPTVRAAARAVSRSLGHRSEIVDGQRTSS